MYVFVSSISHLAFKIYAITDKICTYIHNPFVLALRLLKRVTTLQTLIIPMRNRKQIETTCVKMLLRAQRYICHLKLMKKPRKLKVQ